MKEERYWIGLLAIFAVMAGFFVLPWYLGIPAIVWGSFYLTQNALLAEKYGEQRRREERELLE